jgi:YbaB/EbfC DNA-binding family
MSQPQPLLDFLHTLPPFIAKAPPVIGVSEHAFVKVVLQLDRQLTNVSIDPRLLKSPREVRAQVLEAIQDAQEFRDRQVRAIISEHSQVAKLSIWDVEGTLLAVRNRQSEALRSVQGTGTGCNGLVSVARSQRNQITGLVLNSTNLCCRHKIERSIIHAAQQGFYEIQRLYEMLPFPELAKI